MINYIDIGKGTPIIFIHGLGQTLNAWQPQKELADTYRLIMVDLRGHGDSEHINTDITLENMAKDIIELLEYLDLKSIYLCGLSLGGIVAQEVYRQREDLVKGLIIANSTFYIPSILGNKVIEKSKKVLERSKDELIERIVRKDIFHKEFVEEAKQSFYISDSYLECSKVALGFNYFPILLRCRVPVLLIGGLHDSTTPLFNTYIMKWAITNSKMVILNAGHLSNFDCREEFNKAILGLIN
jgi:pimeloyl-ACP methyl ester carboxylesterase